MKKIFIPMAALGFSALMVGGAAAQPTTFDAVDTDGSGTISWAEFEIAFPDVSEAQFMAADTNGDGELDMEELRLLAPQMGPFEFGDGTPTGEVDSEGDTTDTGTVDTPVDDTDDSDDETGTVN
ncbi:EF-hand domain-containing protein [Arsenicitalea aurantiaca]|uniref:EF-hand domain-containing protein n=1 Tax=Arsenicitalea aurantiaca TaxID=1783274 RepID=A0A433X5K1_9HYPH|nr:EF-hand domain-containing protein [Arsenicitalea aurantiaca]RUT29327.1 EF-hand domain-containing protein [Arsenicitalea aurantiaca]